jgi:hypothetical protein
MKRFLIVVGILVGVAAALSGSKAVAADLFPWWFHTRPKPVIVDDLPQTPPAPPGKRTSVLRVDSHPNIPDSHRERQVQPSKSRLMDFLTRGWRSGSQRSK